MYIITLLERSTNLSRKLLCRFGKCVGLVVVQHVIDVSLETFTTSLKSCRMSQHSSWSWVPTTVPAGSVPPTSIVAVRGVRSSMVAAIGGLVVACHLLR